ncbi:hypothetical protein DFR50_103188 [Roseiarcus fermentans]|uniref:Uncharacterized protein n=1 Tax=Roseiarcus fermentans TaxID=1473586 RepID=A0A366FRZ4_9HYPH|nr:hypothetical protein DFR50_103188 [Roseiarcus fermentans]
MALHVGHILFAISITFWMAIAWDSVFPDSPDPDSAP